MLMIDGIVNYYGCFFSDQEVNAVITDRIRFGDNLLVGKGGRFWGEMAKGEGYCVHMSLPCYILKSLILSTHLPPPLNMYDRCLVEKHILLPVSGS